MEKDHNDPRALLAKMRNGNHVQETIKDVEKQPTTQDFVKKMRKLHEELEQPERVSLLTPEDQPREEENLNNELEPFNVLTAYVPLEVYNDYVYWGGIVDNDIKFTYRVPKLEGERGVTFGYNKETDELPAKAGASNVDKDVADAEEVESYSEETQNITDAIKNYYEREFFPYWSENILQRRMLK